MQSILQKRADHLSTEGHWLGGPPQFFDAVGRHQLITLLRQGLMPSHKVLDVGCGCLRAGFWLLHFLDEGCYFGIEPNEAMLQLGKAEVAGDKLINDKAPHFSNRDDFDFSCFGETFDFILARSIWTHAAPWQIGLMLEQFSSHSVPSGVLLASYLPATKDQPQYTGKDWVGRSNVSSQPGMVTYEFDWIAEQCANRGLTVRELQQNMLRQVWLRIDRLTPRT